ncbi:aminotransferase class IV [Corynebacterium imitans]|uniref:aminotransferase class IV n=1 Tax=Corynebacterium imitans TaxID=156978 RepID=UPI00254A9863|nr:aminotransferase class IV [Corynebacterium imitans]MDK8305694.1 aminotransferase class IV [Corynebacterium imitans]MDK8636840.1 aminotransferase class IV [Corynebacterium imitans]MDK8773660.1 aminotransferase class IV [Corynebacterium imitans]
MRRYAWHGSFVERDFPDGSLEVVDSWRHSSGRAHGLEAHLARFVRTAGPLPAGFVDAMLPLLAEGELFPRIALSAGLLLLDVRPAPAPRPSTALTYVAADDPRTKPEVKGPDFAAFRSYRDSYQVAGTDDTVIVDAQGAMLETTTGALVMWDGDTLCLPDGVRLPSITLGQVTTRAQQLGLRVERRRLFPELANDHPLWFLNSLHGISPVSELWDGERVLTPPPHPDVDAWRAWWWDGFQPV